MRPVMTRSAGALTRPAAANSRRRPASSRPAPRPERERDTSLGPAEGASRDGARLDPPGAAPDEAVPGARATRLRPGGEDHRDAPPPSRPVPPPAAPGRCCRRRWPPRRCPASRWRSQPGPAGRPRRRSRRAGRPAPRRGPGSPRACARAVRRRGARTPSSPRMSPRVRRWAPGRCRSGRCRS